MAEPVPCPDDEVDVVADGKPPPLTARRRKELADGYIASRSGPGGSNVFLDNSGEVVAERQVEAEGGVSAGAAGDTLESAGSSPSTAADYVKVSEPSSLADPAGDGDAFARWGRPTMLLGNAHSWTS